MKVRINIPEGHNTEKDTYFGLKNGQVYTVLRDLHDIDDNVRTLVLLGDPQVLYDVYVDKNWCKEVPSYQIKLPEDLWD